MFNYALFKPFDFYEVETDENETPKFIRILENQFYIKILFLGNYYEKYLKLKSKKS